MFRIRSSSFFSIKIVNMWRFFHKFAAVILSKTAITYIIKSNEEDFFIACSIPGECCDAGAGECAVAL
jgi:hypothetical protein